VEVREKKRKRKRDEREREGWREKREDRGEIIHLLCVVQ
jgi:hypothetical protein